MHKNSNAMRWGVRIHALCYLAANLIQVLVWWLFTPELHFWPIWSIVGWGVGLVVHFWTVGAAVQKADASRRTASTSSAGVRSL
jgi:hypothetical protein